MQAIYESVRLEALQNRQPASWALERVRRYGVASLFVDTRDHFPFIIYAQSIARPPWSGRRDLLQETLLDVYEFLTQEVKGDASSHLCQSFKRETGEGAYDRLAIGSLAGLFSQKRDASGRGVYR